MFDTYHNSFDKYHSRIKGNKGKAIATLKVKIRYSHQTFIFIRFASKYDKKNKVNTQTHRSFLIDAEQNLHSCRKKLANRKRFIEHHKTNVKIPGT